MANQLLTRKRLLMAKVEATYGVDPIPTAQADALLMSNISVSPMEMNTAERNNIKAYMGNNPSVLAAIYATVGFDIEVAGSGTAGVAPAYDELLRGCGLSATTLAAVVTGTATAGSANGATLAASASAVDGTYVGLTVNITAGTRRRPERRDRQLHRRDEGGDVHRGRSATALDNTSVYTFPAQVVYKPVSGSLESVAFLLRRRWRQAHHAGRARHRVAEDVGAGHPDVVVQVHRPVHHAERRADRHTELERLRGAAGRERAEHVRREHVWLHGRRAVRIQPRPGDVGHVPLAAGRERPGRADRPQADRPP